MLVLTNWWWPYSQASILSALSLGYDVYVIVSKSDDTHWEWLNELYSHYGDRVAVEFDSKPRNSKAAHTLTRFEYLHKVLQGSQRRYDQVMITDAEVIHQRRLSLEPGKQVALIESPVWPVDAVLHYARQYLLPFWWTEAATRIVAECMIIRPSVRGIDFALRLKTIIEQLGEEGFYNRWGNDQVALFLTCIRQPRDEIQHLKSDNMYSDVDADPTAAVWYAMPFERENKNSLWNIAATDLIAKAGIAYNIGESSD